MYSSNFPIGAKPIFIEETHNNEFEDSKVMCTMIEGKPKLYTKELKEFTNPNYYNYIPIVYYAQEDIKKRLINTQHKYPELVGTLDKCKFVLNKEAADAGVFDNPSVKIFERDFMAPLVKQGILAGINSSEVIDVVAELKYDGVSVEAEVLGDTILSALSRGDTADNIATDLTPIFGGYKFPYAANVNLDYPFGIKFEAIITKRNLERISEIRGKVYKNARNAIIGILSATDSYKFKNYITLIPLATSLDMPRIDELKFLNHYYNSGEYNRYIELSGTYIQLMYQIYEFRNSAEQLRSILPYLIDGIVISFIDPNIISKLGRVNSVNKYQMAIKFNPKVVRTIFLGYTFTVGKTGDITPMVHFKPCEFLGGIHTKQTIHSYERFKELNLIVGQEIDIEYRNEVITYVTKPDTEHNRKLEYESHPLKFIEECPFCGSKIEISPSGKSAKCLNIKCPERNVYRIATMMEELGIVNFGEQTVRLLNITSLTDLLDPNSINLDLLGPVEKTNYLNEINKLKSVEIPDYKLMTALGYPGIGPNKWQSILRLLTIKELIELANADKAIQFPKINGVSSNTLDMILDYTLFYEKDVINAINNLHIADSKGSAELPRISFTGFNISGHSSHLD